MRPANAHSALEPVAITSELVGRVLQAYVPDHPFQLLETHFGSDNDVAVVALADSEHVAVRFPHPHHGYLRERTPSDYQYELAFQLLLNTHGLPVPALHRAQQGDWYTTITVDGRQQPAIVNDALTGARPDRFSLAMVGQVAQVMATMHRLSLGFPFHGQRRWPGSLLELTSQRITDVRAALASREIRHVSESFTALIDRFKQTSPRLALDLPVGPLHGDLQAGNIRFDGEALRYIFDFDNTRQGWLLEDVTKTLLHSLDDPSDHMGATPDHVARFLESYGAVRPFTSAERQLLPWLTEARCIYEVSKYARQLTTDPEQYAGKITRYLTQYDRLAPVIVEYAS